MSVNESKIQGAIEVLEEELKPHEETARHLKQMINDLCVRASLPARYPDVERVSSGVSHSIRGDQFYGRPLATVVREYLELRKSTNQGPATISDIYEALQKGGYQFGASSDKSAKDGLRISLLKNPAFHKLPNNSFGVASWYPAAMEDKPKRGRRIVSKKMIKRHSDEVAEPIVESKTVRKPKQIASGADNIGA